jgi:O-succinylbenzoate synthase
VGEYDVSVVKPVINKVQKICDAAQMTGRKVVVTSYMDHPVGQCYAAYCAGIVNEQYLGLVDKRCGLMTHGLFDSNAFTERLGKVSPHWNSNSRDKGLGFDDLLEEIDWKYI